jgi:hypothetical protein
MGAAVAEAASDRAAAAAAEGKDDRMARTPGWALVS